jgi:hypothetical protein
VAKTSHAGKAASSNGDVRLSDNRRLNWPRPPLRLGKAKPFKRVLGLDMEHCPHCGSSMRVIAALLERAKIQKILNHLYLDPQPPPRGAAQEQYKEQMSFDDTKSKPKRLS